MERLNAVESTTSSELALAIALAAVTAPVEIGTRKNPGRVKTLT